MFSQTATNFNTYFWTPYPFIVLILIAIIESILIFNLLSLKSSSVSFRYLMLTTATANLLSFFSEYYLSIFLNGGHRILVWIPWVRIIDHSEQVIYLISFPIIFVFTVFSEVILFATLLKRWHQWKQMLKAVFLANLISTTALIVVFNCIVFIHLTGEEEGYWFDPLPQTEKLK